MECIYCGVEIESDDNFCWKCGHWTVRGYTFFKNQNNVDIITKGSAIKQKNRFSMLISITMITFLVFFIIIIIRGDDLFKPFIFLKKQVTNYIYGYNTSIMKTDNTYSGVEINTIEDAYKKIEEDFELQVWQCTPSLELDFLERDLEKSYDIPSVSLCDISYEQAEKISQVIKNMYSLFPNIKGGLTNITITNSNTQSEYIAYFQPMYQFVNHNEDIKQHNKVNKTQILLNSYYFLNEDIMSKSLESVVGNGWYVKDATWESTIAHEFGHYISFMVLLKDNGLNNIVFENNYNYEQINNVLDIFDSGNFSKGILEEALINYNSKYGENLNLDLFALSISKYAGIKDKNDVLISEETIAEAIHDYYLHGSESAKSSQEIVDVIKSRL